MAEVERNRKYWLINFPAGLQQQLFSLIRQGYMKESKTQQNHINFRHSIQARLLLIMGLLVFIPLIAIQGISTAQAMIEMTTQVQSGFTASSGNETRSIQDWADERLQDVKTLAAMEDIQSLEGDKGQQIVDNYKKQWGVFETLVAFDTKGLTVFNTDHKQIDAHEREYFITALAGKDFVSEPLISKGTGHVVLFFAVPLVSNGQTVGVMAGNVNFDEIGAMLAQQNPGVTGDTFLINKEGLVVTPLKYEEELKASGVLEEDKILLSYKVDTLAGQQIVAGKSGTGRYTNYLGKAVMGSYTWMPSLKLGLIIEQQENEILAPINQNLRVSVAVIVLILILLGVIIFFVSRSISRPIKNMAGLADQLAKGDTAIDTTTNRKDEFGLLARSFQNIVASEDEMTMAARRIADGDLTVEFNPRSEVDKLGASFVQMTGQLRQLVSHVSSNANTLEAASEQLASSAQQSNQASTQITTTIQQITKGITLQSESIGQTANSMEQMSRAIDGVAKGAQDQAASVSNASELTNQLLGVIHDVSSNAVTQAQGAKDSVVITQSSSKTIEQSIQGMQRIQSKVNLTAAKVQEMGERSDQIGSIVETIGDIASQTNLLALNAAIEAARAGEHGKGFAVVADEVRKLAEKSSGATKEITELVKSIQNTVADAVQAMKDSATEVQNGVALGNQSGQALSGLLDAAVGGQKSGETISILATTMSELADRLVTAMDSVSAVVEENTAATEEMAAGATEVTRAIENIASASEENSAATEEVSASAEEMSAQVEEVTSSAETLASMAHNLQDLITRFKL
jgi:methyl-accepting chemotaxis protein